MKYVALSCIMTLSLAGYGFATNPCANGNGTNMGGVTQYKCEDLASRCTWYPSWDYYWQSQRTCNYWCCWDAYGNLSNVAVSDCGPWAAGGCCDNPSGGYYNAVPTCPTPN